MMATKYGKVETQKLVEMLASAASDRGLALRAAEPRSANTLYKLMVTLYKEIKDRGLEAQRQILPLLRHENPNVRASAAYFALEFDPETAEPALERILEEEHNMVGFSSRMVLQQWREGKLRFP